jgi:hypothetical protein
MSGVITGHMSFFLKLGVTGSEHTIVLDSEAPEHIDSRNQYHIVIECRERDLSAHLFNGWVLQGL